MLEPMSLFIQELKISLDGPGASAVAILLSAMLAGVYALISNFCNRKIVRDRETIDLVNRTTWDHDFITARDKFALLRDQTNGLVNCCNNTDEDEYKLVIQYLNYYELVAIGMSNGILSERVFRKFFLTRYVKDWRAAKGFIETVRVNNKNPKIFIEYEKAARNWEKKIKNR